MKVTARSRVFAVLGDPVAHSLSPAMQNAGFQAAGLDAVYVALSPSKDALVTQMASLVRSGGGGNVTIPFKEIAAAAPATRDARVELLGSANVFGGANGVVHVGNTDVTGILCAIDSMGVEADAWLVIGTGGSARAAIGAALERGARVAVQSRAPERAAKFAEWATSIGVAAAEHEECRLVINTTPLGLEPQDPAAVDIESLARGVAVLDLVYELRGPTNLVRECRARGINACDGREVLLAQGVASWQLWFPGLSAPVEVMRAALDGRLV